MHYEGGKVTLQQPLTIDGVHPDNYYISGVTAAKGVLYVLEINASKIFRLSGPNYNQQISAPTGLRPYSAELSPDGKVLAVSNWGGESVSLLDPETLKTISTVHTGSHPNEMVWL